MKVTRTFELDLSATLTIEPPDAQPDWTSAELDEDFSQGKYTTYRLHGSNWTGEVYARDCDWSGYGWPTKLDDDDALERCVEALKEEVNERLIREGGNGCTCDKCQARRRRYLEISRH